ncbi:hypothetical protein NIES4106_62240 (plasmid) [Fischerella sp. NIES-4106]|nr:hypothetical protein NIES4106_61900 [Fischerella sp. NIES-4106]BAZ71427.1 hypothetical protein NIES4106_62240 [Fischerella sp. NIES-4106]
MKLNELKREILRRIAIARKEYFRLKKELSEIGSTLPQGTYLSTYTSNSKNPHTYYCLAHKQGLLVSAIDKEKRVYKFHLGRKENPRYLEGILAIERSQTAKAKQTALNAVTEYLVELKTKFAITKSLIKEQGLQATLDSAHQSDFQDFINFKQESIFDFIVGQHVAAKDAYN